MWAPRILKFRESVKIYLYYWSRDLSSKKEVKFMGLILAKQMSLLEPYTKPVSAKHFFRQISILNEEMIYWENASETKKIILNIPNSNPHSMVNTLDASKEKKVIYAYFYKYHNLKQSSRFLISVFQCYFIRTSI